MNIYVTRHGQTRLNKKKIMQGRTNEPLNEIGREQAKKAHEAVKDVKFDAVYASPLDRAQETASIIAGVDRSELIIDERIIEADFGKYEMKSYYGLGPAMTLFWGWPEVFKAPKTAESVEHMVERSHEFLRELEAKDYENVLVVCHGGIIRPICGYLEDIPRGYRWRPRPTNCEIRVYECIDGKHKLIDDIINA